MSSPPALPHVLVDARFSALPRGGDRCRLELAAHLARQAAARYTFLAYPYAATLLPAGGQIITTRWTPERHPWADVFEHVTLPRKGRRIGADIYHGTFNVLPLIAPARRRVVTIHDMAVFAYPQGYGARFAAYMRLLLGASIRAADRILTVSEATRRELLRLFPQAEPRTSVVLNGVGDEFLEAATLAPGEVDAVRRRLALPTPYVLFVGNLEPKKNLPRLIAAFRRLCASTPLPHSLVVVGKPLDEGPGSGVTGEAGTHDRIVFTGYVNDKDLPALYRGADLVAYPSLYEGFGMPVLEGMAAGVPVLTSNVSSLPEVAGGAAWLVDPLDVEDMAAGLHGALTDTGWRARAVRAGRERAEKLTWAENARQTAAAYHQVWDGGRGQ